MTVQVNSLVAGNSNNTISNSNVSFNTAIGGNGASIAANNGSEALLITPGSFTFTGPAGRFTLNHNSAWVPLIANMPGFYGARSVINWFLNSDTPEVTGGTQWDLVSDSKATYTTTTDTLNGVSIESLNIANSSQDGGPYERGYAGTVHGATVVASPYASGQWAKVNAWPPGTLMSVRFAARVPTGGDPTAWDIYQRATDGSVAPTESLGSSITLSTSYATFTGTMEQNSGYTALGSRVNLHNVGSGNGYITRMQIEDVSGDTDSLIPSEYVPSGSTPGWKWFGTSKGTSATNSTYTANYVALCGEKNPSVSYAGSGGTITDGSGTTLSTMKGLVMEPAASNIASGWNTLGNIGHFKSSGAISSPVGAVGTRPWAAGVTTIYYEAPSGMMVGNFNGTAPTDITLTLNGVSAGNDSIDSTTTNFVTAGFFVGMTIWVWRADTLTFGPMPVASVTATKIGLTGTFFGVTRASGTVTRIMRCPGNGDNIMLQLNDGTFHRTTVSGAVTLPAAGAWGTKAGVTVPITAGPPTDGGWSTGSTDNGVHGFYWKDHTDFGISIAGGTGVTCKPVFDRSALITAGLGWLCPTGLVLEIFGGSGATTTVALGGTTGLGTATRDTRISVYAKKISGTDMRIKLENGAHTAFTALSGSTWTRYTCTESSLGTQNIPTISNVTAGSTTYVILWQTEQASDVAANQTGVTSSPIILFGATAAKTRTATRAVRAWNSTATNNIGRSLTWTPSTGALAQKQVLWSLYADASNYLELSITNTTITWLKRRGGVNTSITASYTPVAGTACNLTFQCRSDSGLTLSVNGTPATPSVADLANITALTPAAQEDIGTNQGSTGAYGYFSNLQVL